MTSTNAGETDGRSLEQLTKNQIGLNENISNLVKKVAHLEERRNDLAILWDVQNINPGTKSPFVEGLIEYVSEYGKLVIAKAFGDWSQDNIKKLAIPLSQNGFEMIHIPDIVKRKNASDMEMITHGIEIIMQHPNIDHYFIIASDIDFRPFVNALRRNGKLTTIIYDHKRVNDALLALADNILDYRQLFPGGDIEELEETMTDDTALAESMARPKVQRSQEPTNGKQKLVEAFSLLVEAIEHLESTKSGTSWSGVKVRMKILKPTFDEKGLGFKKWSDFLNAAVEEDVIKLVGKGSEGSLATAASKSKYDQGNIPSDLVIEVLTELDMKEFDNNPDEKPIWHLMSRVNEELNKKGFKYKSHGYSRFKQYMLDLQTREIIEVDAEGLTYLVKRRI